jgi:hypothetical protein
MKVFYIFYKFKLFVILFLFFFLGGKPILVVEFKGHKEKINELAWNPHRNLMLLSCSNDFTAKVCLSKISIFHFK